MLHSIKEVCELTGKSRSSIYRMFGRGDLAYMVGKDGKRRVETSELLRVFDEINFNDSPTLAEPVEVTSSQSQGGGAGGDPYITARELTDLRGMIHELRDELDDLREDNRRLLRLLEYQTTQRAAPPPPSQRAEPVAPPPSTAPEAALDPLDEEEPVPVTSVAEQGWKAYREQRAEQKQQEAPQPSASVESGMVNELGAWLKSFFFGEWQKRP